MHIKSDAYIEKANKLAEGEVEFVVSTSAWDRHGERINVDGIDFKQYKKNPVVLFGHDSFNLPIAKTTKIWKEAGKLMARAKFNMKDAFPRQVYEYIMDGFLSAVSIGGMVEQWGEDGLTIDKLSMAEFSVVSVPANPEAVVSAKALGNDQMNSLKALANAYARKTLAVDESEVVKNIELLENLVASLKEVAISEPQDGTAPTNTRVVLRQAQVVDQQAEKTIKSIKVTLKES